MNKVLIKPLLLIVAVIVCLIMIRLGIWQLDRASQKQTILDAQISQSQRQPIPLASVLEQITSDIMIENQRFLPVTISGHFKPDATIFVDNRVLDHKVGYQVFTPFKLATTDTWVMVDRGWVAVGESRELLPEIKTISTDQVLTGRLNNPPSQPPLWNDKYSVSKGSVWQYLPIQQYSQNSGLKILPLVVELAPDANSENTLVKRWQTIDDKWVAKHKAYAFQWFAMALALFIASIVLTIRSNKKH